MSEINYKKKTKLSFIELNIFFEINFILIYVRPRRLLYFIHNMQLVSVKYLIV